MTTSEQLAAMRRRRNIAQRERALREFESVDPIRAAETVHLGTPLRDAAVDPRPGDWLVPTNAGMAGPLGNPHGPHVVAPELPELQEQRSGPWPPKASA